MLRNKLVSFPHHRGSPRFLYSFSTSEYSREARKSQCCFYSAKGTVEKTVPCKLSKNPKNVIASRGRALRGRPSPPTSGQRYGVAIRISLKSLEY